MLQSYLGTTPRAAMDPSPDADHSWITVATLQAPATGSLAYLNEVVALAVGWVEDGKSRHDYRIRC